MKRYFNNPCTSCSVSTMLSEARVPVIGWTVPRGGCPSKNRGQHHQDRQDLVKNQNRPAVPQSDANPTAFRAVTQVQGRQVRRQKRGRTTCWMPGKRHKVKDTKAKESSITISSFWTPTFARRRSTKKACKGTASPIPLWKVGWPSGRLASPRFCAIQNFRFKNISLRQAIQGPSCSSQRRWNSGFFSPLKKMVKHKHRPTGGRVVPSKYKIIFGQMPIWHLEKPSANSFKLGFLSPKHIFPTKRINQKGIYLEDFERPYSLSHSPCFATLFSSP